MTYFTAGTLINDKIKVCSDKMKVFFLHFVISLNTRFSVVVLLKTKRRAL